MAVFDLEDERTAAPEADDQREMTGLAECAAPAMASTYRLQQPLQALPTGGAGLHAAATLVVDQCNRVVAPDGHSATLPLMMASNRSTPAV